jgi:HAD superfamily hydrolase (TIGR01490 family)
MRLVLFDLDHTLLDGDSNQLWLGWLVARGLAPAERLGQQAAFYARYESGGLDIDAYLAFHLSLLADRPLADWVPLRRDWVGEVIEPRLAPAGRAAVQAHRVAGDRLAVVTATHGWLVDGIVAALGGPTVLASEPELSDGRITGRLVGAPCFADRKLPRVHAWLAAQGLAFDAFEAVRFYSDSFNDLPLLEAVHEPVAVNADQRLGEIADRLGWPRLSWRAVPLAG